MRKNARGNARRPCKAQIKIDAAQGEPGRRCRSSFPFFKSFMPSSPGNRRSATRFQVSDESRLSSKSFLLHCNWRSRYKKSSRKNRPTDKQRIKLWLERHQSDPQANVRTAGKQWSKKREPGQSLRRLYVFKCQFPSNFYISGPILRPPHGQLGAPIMLSTSALSL